jgi:flagellin
MDEWVASIARRTSNGTGSAVSTLAEADIVGFGKSFDPFGSAIGAPGYLDLYTDAASGVVSLDGAGISSDGSHTPGQIQYQAALAIQDMIKNGGGLGATVTDVGSGLADANFTSPAYAGAQLRVPRYPWDSVTDFAANIDAHIELVDTAVNTVRSTMATMGSNTALLQIRIDFTERLVIEAKTGAAKLVNADLNEESANMVSLQTRREIGTQSLKFAADTEKGILSLFR